MSTDETLGADLVAQLYEAMRSGNDHSSLDEVLAISLGESESESAEPIGIRCIAVRSPTLPPATHTNTYVLGSQRVAIVDVGSWNVNIAQALTTALAERGQQVVAVIATHHHGDHVGGIAAAAAHFSAPIFMHEVGRRRTGIASELLQEGDRVPLIDSEWTTIYTPGHADSHLCFVSANQKWAVVGDMLTSNSSIVIDPSDGDMILYLQSLQRLEAMQSTTLLPAHGAPILPDAKLPTKYIAHRLGREQKIVDAMTSAPQTAAQLVTSAYADTPTFLWPIAERSLLSHLRKLVVEGRAVQSTQGYALT